MKKIIKWIIIGFLVLTVISIIFAAVSGDVESTEKKAEPVEAKQEVVVNKVTKEDAPELYEQWGDEWIEKINTSMQPALETVAKHKKCKNPEYIGLSEAYSEPKEKVVYFVDCKGKDRRYLSLDNIGDTEQAKTDKELARDKEKAQNLMLATCQVQIKNSLKNPKSFDTEYSSIKQGVDPETKNNIVGFKFYAQNGFGAEIIHQAVCVFDKDGNMIDIGIE